MAKVSVEENKITKKSKKGLFKKGLYAFVVIALVFFGAFYFVQYNKVNDKYNEVSKTEDQRKQEIVSKLAKLMDLPKDKKPEVAVFPGKESFSSSPTVEAFYANAQKGDYVIAYKDSNLTIIYRDSDNKIIKSGEYAYYTAGINPVKVAIIAPEASQASLEKLINERILNADVASKTVPKVGSSQNIVIDATGANPTTAKELADKLGLAVGSLPDGETKPENVALIVFGANVTQ